MIEFLAQLKLRQNKYICCIVRKGRGRQSWIEDEKEERIKSVTSCVNPGFFSNSYPAALGLNATKLSCPYIPLNPHKCLHFHQKANYIFDIFHCKLYSPIHGKINIPHIDPQVHWNQQRAQGQFDYVWRVAVSNSDHPCVGSWFQGFKRRPSGHKPQV